LSGGAVGARAQTFRGVAPTSMASLLF